MSSNAAAKIQRMVQPDELKKTVGYYGSLDSGRGTQNLLAGNSFVRMGALSAQYTVGRQRLEGWGLGGFGVQSSQAASSSSASGST